MVETSVVVLNYKQAALTIACVKSVLRQSYKNFDIVLVDNGSNDGSVELFGKEFGSNRKVKIIANNENLGYTGGNNTGVKSAKGKYLVILNNDTLQEREWLSELINTLKSSERVALASSNIVNVPAFKNLQRYRRFALNRQWGTNNILGYYINTFTPSQSERAIPQFQVHGGAFALKKNLVPKPLFDSDYFIYAEETKLCWLMRSKGYEIVAAPKAVVYHLENIVRKSDKRINKYFTFLGERNKIMNWLTLYECFTILRFLPYFFFAILFINIFEPRKIPYRLNAYLWLLLHPFTIARKRNEARRWKKLPDKELLQLMSCKLQEPSKIKNAAARAFLHFVNFISCLYCTIVGFRMRGLP